MKLTKVLLVAGGLVAGAVAGNAITTLAQPASPAVLDSQSTFVEMTPCRLVDTRTGRSAEISGQGQIGQGESRTYSGAGSCGVPSNATSLSVNLTSVGSTFETYMTLWDTGAAKPNASTLNPNPLLPVSANTTNVPLSTSGKFDIYNFAGQVDYVIDVLGYYVDGFGTSAIPNLPDTGDGFSLISDHYATTVSERCTPINPSCTNHVDGDFWGAVVNLENEARWVQVVSASRCPAYSLNGSNYPALEPGTIISDPLRVEPKSTTAVLFTGPCGGREDAVVDGGGTMFDAVAAQTFATKEFIPD